MNWLKHTMAYKDFSQPGNVKIGYKPVVFKDAGDGEYESLTTYTPAEAAGFKFPPKPRTF